MIIGKIVGAFSLALAATLPLAVAIPGAAEAEEIVVRISRVRALGKIDANSEADFYALVVIAGETFKTDPIKDKDDIRPNWVFTKKVAPGAHDVKITIMDKDVALDDMVDINRVDKKRDLDFKVDTERCAIIGFSEGYRCGSTIIRSGSESKPAEIRFSVDVKR